jgi:hypothetical protein
MRTPKTLLCALMLSVMPAALGMMRPVATAGKTDLYGGIGRGSPLNPGALITVDQDTGAGALVGHPDSVPGLTGLVFDISGTLYGTTISGALGTGRVSNLVRIDPGTGAQIGPAVPITANDLPISITDLALQPAQTRSTAHASVKTILLTRSTPLTPPPEWLLLSGTQGSSAQHSPSGPTGRSIRRAPSLTTPGS